MASPRKPVSKPTFSQPKTQAAPAVAPVAPAPAPVVVERSEVKGSGKPKMPALRTPSHSEIQKRAYEIYVGRGYAAGDPSADWLEAERQLKAGL